MLQMQLPAIQGKAAKSPIDSSAQKFVFKKERSASASSDRGGVIGLEAKLKGNASKDDVPQTRQVQFRMSANNYLNEPPAETTGLSCYSGTGTFKNSNTRDTDIVALSTDSVVQGSGQLSRSILVASRFRPSTTTPTAQKRTMFGVEQIAGNGEEEEDPPEKKFTLSQKGWTKKEISTLTRKQQQQQQQQSQQSQSQQPFQSMNKQQQRAQTSPNEGTSVLGEYKETLPKQEQQQRLSTNNPSQKLTQENTAGVPKIVGAQGLTVKVMELWISDTLQEAELGAQSRLNGGVAPSSGGEQKEQKDMLQLHGIDRKSLLAQGISKEKVDRLYRSLFVYSFGFYEMMEDIFGHQSGSLKVVSKIWKIFGQLLEHCCRSDFQNTVTQLEKENLIVMDQLQVQIQTQNNQYEQLQTEQERRILDLLDQIASLTAQNELLLTQKMQVEEEYKQADAAFNEEVGLRLQFEHKINELHSIHRELLSKHNRLLDEYNHLKGESDIWKMDLRIAQIQADSMKVNEVAMQNEIKTQQWKITEMTQMSDSLKERVTKSESQLVQQSKGMDKFEGLYYEEKRMKSDLAFRTKNLTEKLEMAQKTEQIYIRRIEDMKAEEAILRQKIRDQEDKLTADQTEFDNLKKEGYMHGQEVQRLMDQINSEKKVCAERENDIIVIQGEKKKVQLQYEYSINRNQLLSTDLEAMQSMVKDFKLSRSELEGEFVKCKLKLTNAQDAIKAKNNQCKELQVKMEVYEQKLLKVTVEYQAHKNMCAKETEGYKQKINKLERELKTKIHESEQDQEKIEYLTQKSEKFAEQVDSLRRDIIELNQQESRHKFEMNTMSNNINQLNSVISTEQERNDQIINQIAQLIAANEGLSRETKSQTVVIRELQTTHHDSLRQLVSRHSRELQKYQHTEPKVSAMEYEDMRTQFQVCSEEKIVLEKKVTELSLNLENLKLSVSKNNEKFHSASINFNKAQITMAALKQHLVHALKKVLAGDKQLAFRIRQVKELQEQLDQQRAAFDQEARETKKNRDQIDAMFKEDYDNLMEKKKNIDRLYDESHEEIGVLKGTLAKLQQEIQKLQDSISSTNTAMQQLELQNQQLQQLLQQQSQQMPQPRNSRIGSISSANNQQKGIEFPRSYRSDSISGGSVSSVLNQETHFHQQSQANNNQKTSDAQQTVVLSVPTIKIASEVVVTPQITATEAPISSNQQAEATLVVVNKRITELKEEGKENVDRKSSIGISPKSTPSAAGGTSRIEPLNKKRMSKKETFESQLTETEQSQIAPASVPMNLASHNQHISTAIEFFVPYHLSDLGKMNYKSSEMRQTFDGESQLQTQNRASTSSSYSGSGGAYRLSAKHSAQIRSETTKKLKQPQVDRQSIGRLFQIAQERSNTHH